MEIKIKNGGFGPAQPEASSLSYPEAFPTSRQASAPQPRSGSNSPPADETGDKKHQRDDEQHMNKPGQGVG